MSDSTYPRADAGPPLPLGARPRPWFPWYLYLLVSYSGLQAFALAEARSPGWVTGQALGGAFAAYVLMLLAYRLTKRAWVAILAWLLLLVVPASQRLAEARKVRLAFEAVHTETGRLSADFAITLHDFNTVGGMTFSTLVAEGRLGSRREAAVKGRDEATGVLALLEGGPPMLTLLEGHRLSARELERTTVAIQTQHEYPMLCNLMTAHRDGFDAAIALLDLLHDQRGRWSIGEEGQLLFDESVADTTVTHAQALLAAFTNAESRIRDVLARTAKK